jgi:hypothetical protein
VIELEEVTLKLSIEYTVGIAGRMHPVEAVVESLAESAHTWPHTVMEVLFERILEYRPI